MEVQSPNVSEINWKKSTLFVTFKNGKHVAYKDVPQNIYHELLNAESIGSYLNRKVKGKFRYEVL